MSTNRCIVCGCELTKAPLMNLYDMPASAQNIPLECQLEDEKGISLALHQCGNCGLVQFDCEPVAYYRDVIRSGGFSTTMVELRKSQYKKLIETYHLEGKRFLEAGCGRGEFLKVLSENFPVKAYGIENRKDLAEIACQEGLHVWQQFTEHEWDRLESKPGQAPYDVFLSFNFLEHQPEPGTMLKCIYHNLTEDGMGLITVPSLEYILEHDGYYELIRDHLAYYTFNTLRYVLELHGFEVLEQEMVNRDTLTVVVKKIPGFNFEAAKKEQKTEPLPVDIEGLKQSLTVITKEVNRLVTMMNEENKTLAVWGASHQGFTLASTTKLGDRVNCIIDSAPFKQGRFSPASHIPIISPEYAVNGTLLPSIDAVLIVAPGYTDEISSIIRERFKPGIQIFTLRSNHIEEI